MKMIKDPQTSHNIDIVGGIAAAIISSNEFVHALNDVIALIVGIMSIVWFGIRIYDWLTNKKPPDLG
jgi:hypothetical protein